MLTTVSLPNSVVICCPAFHTIHGPRGWRTRLNRTRTGLLLKTALPSMQNPPVTSTWSGIVVALICLITHRSSSSTWCSCSTYTFQCVPSWSGPHSNNTNDLGDSLPKLASNRPYRLMGLFVYRLFSALKNNETTLSHRYKNITGKLEMVKSKCGLAFSACFTVVASLCMSLGLCISIGLMVPTLNGSEIFPYLVVLIGFENVIILTKSVVATPIDLPVKYRIAQGLSKESWPLTKQYFTQVVLLGLGFFTFHPTMQEFCLFAVIGVTTDFFLQLFFFVTVLSIDIRRMELSDLSSQYQNLTCLRDPKTLFPVVSEHAVLISNANDSATFKFGPVKQETFIPFVQYCFRRAYTVVGPMLMRTKRYGCKLVARIRPSFKPCHRRRVSAAEAAAFLASDETPTANVPRRLWLLRIWAKHRLVQNLFVFSIALWIVVVILYTLNFSQFPATWRTQQPSSTVSSPVDESYPTDDSNLSSSVNSRTPQSIPNSDHLSSSLETSIYSPTGILKAELHIQANASRIDRALRQLETSGLFNDARRGHLLLQSTHATWDGTLLWNYLAFFQWPLLAKHYNLSLAGCHSVILEPIHLTHKVQASPVTMDTRESVVRPSPYGVSESQADKQRKVGWNNWSWYDFWLDASSSLVNINRDTDGVEMQDGKEVEVVDGSSRLAGFEDLLNLLGVSKSTGEHRRGRRPSSSVSPGGVGGWTARLWLTASILGTSFVGCSCVLLVTCLGMICFQELQAKCVYECEFPDEWSFMLLFSV
ncbi:uncharacterized protein DEA37_0008867 [Paragonimus westermani]|uniref:SSD domain-containing protein n=1 Tax=Paragonimus westermani TaxID=34504 RepID=A0A5J4NG75_9TREM|nr:uncharacterized protein DEA37_0008867 [Paragonimus westermani]